ncbi:sulfatase [Pedobacter psychrophilus]|uniref:Sulfatase n=1 Tax=Pedobacter psychrophilus TaxID=1826909 RepID=A0A179DFF3_9SPHI|nr:alkaline phosphatase family protein [Pedobacter psychrophilus]OAQ39634.1 sulfatase [Pedobacter psychrophilus]
MFKSLSFFLKYFLGWCLFFLLSRIIFEIAFYHKLADLDFLEIFFSFVYGLHMDASMAGYLCVLPFLFYGIIFLSNLKISIKPIKIYTYFFLVIASINCIVNINIYREWGTNLNYRALEFLIKSPSEAFASSASSPIFLNIFGLIVLIFIGFALFSNLVFKTDYFDQKRITLLFKIPVYLFTLALTFLAIRGGIGVAPMNTSKAYYSKHQILNFAAINTNWFLISSIISNLNNVKNPYIYFSESDLQINVESLLAKKDTLTSKIFSVKKPNIVLIVMESFTADVVKELGGEEGVTPKFSELIKEGLLFNHIYATSDRTDKGIVAVISAFPAQGIKSIIKENDKQLNLPSVAKVLKSDGYQTSFFYGGDTDFSNFKSYILSHQYQTLFEKKDFKNAEIKSNWGAYDDVTFSKQISFLNKIKQPFFSTLLTLTNHEPFQLPVKGKFGDNSLPNKFRSTSYFVDEALYQYVQNAKKQAWYANTIFIITADHGHRLPKEIRETYQPEKYHIPLLIFGGALTNKYKGQIINKFGGQTDIASTLLNQLNIPDTAFKYSIDLLNPNLKGFGFYNWDNGFGYIDENGALSYDPVSNHVIFKNQNLTDQQEKNHIKKAKTLMQSVFKDYLEY